VVIDPRPISTLDFTLTETEAEFLLKAGQSAALRLIYRRKLDGGPSESDVRKAESDVDALRSRISAARRSATIRRRCIVALLLLLAAVFLVAVRFVWKAH
jgi:hypothetical protein